jgi:hypothetical protein
MPPSALVPIRAYALPADQVGRFCWLDELAIGFAVVIADRLRAAVEALALA